MAVRLKRANSGREKRKGETRCGDEDTAGGRKHDHHATEAEEQRQSNPFPRLRHQLGDHG